MIEKLAALIPPSRLNLVRYHGVSALNAAARGQFVSGPEPEGEGTEGGTACEPAGTLPRRPCRLTWAQLLSRVFQIHVMLCPAMKVPSPNDPLSCGSFHGIHSQV